MSERTDYSALIERLVAGGPDRGLDGLIARDVAGWVQHFGLNGDDLVYWPVSGGHWESPDARYIPGNSEEPPRYTASIDAALALVERCLGRGDLSINYTGTAASQRWACTIRMDDNPAGDRVGQSDFPAIAILIALLRALSE